MEMRKEAVLKKASREEWIGGWESRRRGGRGNCGCYVI